MSITIICSNFNSNRWIDGYLSSVNNQTLREFSIIFVDASSTDDSVETIEKFKFRDGISSSIIKCPTRINIYEAWNLGIKNARTEYVMNLNTDDRLLPDGLAIYKNSIDKYDADVIYGPCIIMGDDKHANQIGTYNWPEYSHQELLMHCICGPFPLLKKSSVERAGYFDISMPHSADYEMWTRMSFLGMKFVRIPDVVGTYYLNPTGMSTNPENLQKAQSEDAKIQNRYKNKTSKKLSILIPTTSNRSHYLSRLLKILEPQTTDDVEILILNDNHEYSIGDKRNHLVVSSSGEYIVFVDDDDIVSDNYIPLILDGIKSNPDVVGIHLLHYEDGVHKGLTYHSLKYDKWWDEPGENGLRNYYRNPNHLNPVRREYALRVEFPSVNMGEDRDYSKRILPYLKTESYIKEPIYTYLFRTTKEC